MQSDFNTLRSFDYTNAIIHLWIFKKSSTEQKFMAFYVRTDDVLNDMLRDVIQRETARITEFSPYSHLTEVNGSSCLSTSSTGNDFVHLRSRVDRPEPESGVRSIKDLKGAEGYVVKFTHNNQIVYAVKRSTASWKTSYPKKFINMFFKDGELSAAEENGFTIERNFDFYCVNATIFIARKRAFESAMEYRLAYSQAFNNLQQSSSFSSLFTSLQPLITYVGNNAIQLKRMAAIEEKGYYAQPDFLNRLQRVNTSRGWGIKFDSMTNKIIPCDQTARIIVQVLLDHRLISEVTDNIYDVPDTTQV
jgi:hypothetical protein